MEEAAPVSKADDVHELTAIRRQRERRPLVHGQLGRRPDDETRWRDHRRSRLERPCEGASEDSREQCGDSHVAPSPRCLRRRGTRALVALQILELDPCVADVLQPLLRVSLQTAAEQRASDWRQVGR
jgi:hypothetical protein